MGWTAPYTATTGEVWTAAKHNTHIRDNFRYQKGLDGAISIEDALTVLGAVIIGNAGGDEYLHLPLLSTAEIATVLAAEGKHAFDEQTHDLKWHNGTAVISAKDLVTMFIASQAQGDTLYASSATAWARLAKGTAYQLQRMNVGATAPEWFTFSEISAEIAPTEDLFHSHDAEASETNAAYQKKKETTLDRNMANVRIKFDLRTTWGGDTVYGRIYVNGAPRGIEQTHTGDSSWTTFSQDFVGLSEGDTAELHIHSVSGNEVKCRNFRFYGKLIPDGAGSNTFP